MHEGVWFRKNFFWQNGSCENLANFVLIGLLYMHWWCLHGPINFYHSFDGPIWYFAYTIRKHWTYAWRVLVQKKCFFDKMTAVKTETIFSLIRLLYMHRQCLHGRINSYHSFWWSNLILCLYNIDTLIICMKEFGWKKKNLTNDSYHRIASYTGYSDCRSEEILTCWCTRSVFLLLFFIFYKIRLKGYSDDLVKTLMFIGGYEN